MHYFAKMNEAKKYFREMRKFRKNIFGKKNSSKTIGATINFTKKTCGMLCSDSSIFEVILCHINNFSSFTLINV